MLKPQLRSHESWNQSAKIPALDRDALEVTGPTTRSPRSEPPRPTSPRRAGVNNGVQAGSPEATASGARRHGASRFLRPPGPQQVRQPRGPPGLRVTSGSMAAPSLGSSGRVLFRWFWALLGAEARTFGWDSFGFLQESLQGLGKRGGAFEKRYESRDLVDENGKATIFAFVKNVVEKTHSPFYGPRSVPPPISALSRTLSMTLKTLPSRRSPRSSSAEGGSLSCSTAVCAASAAPGVLLTSDLRFLVAHLSLRFCFYSPFISFRPVWCGESLAMPTLALSSSDCLVVFATFGF